MLTQGDVANLERNLARPMAHFFLKNPPSRKRVDRFYDEDVLAHDGKMPKDYRQAMWAHMNNAFEQYVRDVMDEFCISDPYTLPSSVNGTFGHVYAQTRANGSVEFRDVNTRNIITQLDGLYVFDGTPIIIESKTASSRSGGTSLETKKGPVSLIYGREPLVVNMRMGSFENAGRIFVNQGPSILIYTTPVDTRHLEYLMRELKRSYR